MGNPNCELCGCPRGYHDAHGCTTHKGCDKTYMDFSNNPGRPAKPVDKTHRQKPKP